MKVEAKAFNSQELSSGENNSELENQSVQEGKTASSCGCGCGCGGKKRRSAEEKRRGALGVVPEGRSEISLVAK